MVVDNGDSSSCAFNMDNGLIVVKKGLIFGLIILSHTSDTGFLETSVSFDIGKHRSIIYENITSIQC